MEISGSGCGIGGVAIPLKRSRILLVFDGRIVPIESLEVGAGMIVRSLHAYHSESSMDQRIVDILDFVLDVLVSYHFGILR